MASFAEIEHEEVYDLNSKLNEIQKKIITPLSLQQIHKLSDEVESVLKTAFKVAKVSHKILFAENIIKDGEKLLDELEKLKASRKKKDSEKLVELRGLDFRIDAFAIEIFENTPRENEKRLEELYLKIKAFEKENRGQSFALDHAIDQSFQKLSKSHFLLKYPILQELEISSYEPNFIQRIMEVKDAFLLDRAKGTLMFMKLSSQQKEGIYEAMRRMKQIPNPKEMFLHPNVSDFERASAVQEYVDELLHMIEIAHILSYSDENKAFYLLDRLDAKTQEKLDAILREVAQEEGDMKTALTFSILNYVEKQILA